MTNEIIPALLVQSEEHAVTQLMKLGDYSGWIQIDVLDGTLYRFQSFHDPELLSLLLPKNPIELHLMVAEPLTHIEAWTKALGSQHTKRAIWHIEAQLDHHHVIKEAKQLGWSVGIAIGPTTNIRLLEPYLNDIEEVLVLGVHPGQSGQSIIPKTIETAKTLTAQSNNRYLVGFDGGITAQQLQPLADAGVTRFNAASAVFQSGNAQQELQRLTKLLANNS